MINIKKQLSLNLVFTNVNLDDVDKRKLKSQTISGNLERIDVSYSRTKIIVKRGKKYLKSAK